MCNENDQDEMNNEQNIDEMTDDEKKKYQEWFEMMEEIRIKIDLK